MSLEDVGVIGGGAVRRGKGLRVRVGWVGRAASVIITVCVSGARAPKLAGVARNLPPAPALPSSSTWPAPPQESFPPLRRRPSILCLPYPYSFMYTPSHNVYMYLRPLLLFFPVAFISLIYPNCILLIVADFYSFSSCGQNLKQCIDFDNSCNVYQSIYLISY